MRIVFSDHASQQMKERKLTELQINRVVEKPKVEVRQLRNRVRAISIVTRKKKKYAMIVIYDQLGTTKEIVTAFITSKIEKYL